MTPARSPATWTPRASTRTSSTPAAPHDLKDRLAAVERAEERLAAGTYGLSIRSGEPIPDERLEANPTAELTVAEQDPGAHSE